MEFSRFAEHFSSASGIVRLMQDLGQPPTSTAPLRMLGGGNPALITEMEQVFRHEMQALLAQGRRFEQCIGTYAAPQGHAAFVHALTQLLHDTFAWPLDTHNIAITNGSQSSFGVLFNLFAGDFATQPPKKILLPMTPEYMGYAEVGLHSHDIFTANRPTISLDDDGFSFKYHVDFAQLEFTPTIGAVCVSRPTNPTGNVITDDELTHLAAAAKSAKVPLIIDGAYGLPFPNIIFNQARPIWDENIILCLSLSKLGLPGTRTGIVVANQDIISKLQAANAIFNLAPGSFGPELMLSLVESQRLLTLCEQIVRPYYQRKSIDSVQYLRDSLSGLPVRVHKSEGAMFLWLWFENLPITNEELYHRLKRRGVVVVSGSHFFPGLAEDWLHTTQCIRVSYAADWPDLCAGIDIIAAEVRSAYHR